MALAPGDAEGVLKEEELSDEPGEMGFRDLEDEHIMEFHEEPDEEVEPAESGEAEEPEDKGKGKEAVEEKPPAKPKEVAVEKKGGKPAETTEEDPIVTRVGKDTILKVKGKEYKLSEFKPEEVQTFLQKGLRFTQLTQETADRERALDERERSLNASAQRLNALQRTQTELKPGATTEQELPKELKPNDLDSEEMKALKSVAAESWKAKQALTARLDALEGRANSQQVEEASKAFINDIAAMKKSDYPLASLEEVIAIHSLRPDIPVKEIVKKSHEIYSSRQHVDSVLSANPLLRKELKDEMVAEYLSERKKTGSVAGRPSPSLGRVVPARTPGKQIPRNFEEAGKMAKRRIAELEAAAEEA